MKHLFSILLAATCTLASARADDSVVIGAMKEEMNRTMTQLADDSIPPYFVSYQVTEVHSYVISASFGHIMYEDGDHSRILDTDVRVGDYNLDNTRQLRGSNFESSGRAAGTNIPLGNDKAALRVAIWNKTDRDYKSAVERYMKVLTNIAVKVKEEDSSADFSHEQVYKYNEPLKTLKLDTVAWRDKLRRLSAIFQEDPSIYTGQVYLQADVNNHYFVNSEGTEVQTSDTYIRVFAYGLTKAEDGMSLPLYRSYFAFTQEGLPDEATMAKEIRDMVKLLGKLRTAPLMETYSGPAILSGEASGVFFHEIFGHRVEGHRQKDVQSSQTFKNLIGEKILPDFIDVVFDPTIKKLGSRDVVGYFKYDDQGIKAERVVSVKDGVFREFLMSRAPIEGFSHSNGHGRGQPGYGVVARQSNLLVEAGKKVPFAKLREMLREECKEQKKEYGLYFVEIQGGFTFTGRTVPNAFNVQPLVVYKIYADGRPDELVRGVDLIGTPLTTFSNIIAAADDLGIFNGMCGAESGSVPVSASSPSLLVSRIEAQKKSKSQAKPPILPAPSVLGQEKSN